MIWNRKPKKKFSPKKKTLNDILEANFARQLKQSPELLNEVSTQVTSRKLGINLSSDPAAANKREMEKRITEAALEVISNDEELRTQLAEQKAKEMLGLRGKVKRRGEDSDNDGMESMSYEESGSPFSRALQEFRELTEFQEELGIKKDTWGDIFKDPEVVKAVLGFLMSMSGKVPVTTQPPATVKIRTYVVNIDGVDKELSESEYLKLKASESKALEAHKEETKPQDSKPVESKTEKDSIMEYLNYEPEAFVSQLNQLASTGNTEAAGLREMLIGASYDSIVRLLEPYKNTEKYKKYVDHIISHKEWVESVLNIINGNNGIEDDNDREPESFNK